MKKKIIIFFLCLSWIAIVNNLNILIHTHMHVLYFFFYVNKLNCVFSCLLLLIFCFFFYSSVLLYRKQSHMNWFHMYAYIAHAYRLFLTFEVSTTHIMFVYFVFVFVSYRNGVRVWTTTIKVLYAFLWLS